ncbi:MAG: gliding motility-associated C-terminal domain-containing protein [Emticicia sp.]
MPTQCTNPGGGILVGGAFKVSPEFGCLDFANNTATSYVSNPLAPSGGSLSNLGYIFDLKDGRSITSFPPLQTSITVSNPGIYWILQGGNDGSINYITCKSFEVIKTDQPDIRVSSCGARDITVTFLNTPKNQTHGGYKILWGDGNQQFIDGILPTGFPFNIPHTYTSLPTSNPQIVANYTRGGLTRLCPSTPYLFSTDTNNPPKISELEGLTGGTSNKITMVEGSDGKPYILEQKTKTGNWADTGIKITRNIGETFKTETVTGLNAANEYCFRLKTTDGCSNPILSNEVCTIVPKANVISPDEVKLDWTSPNPAVTRYSIDYSESPTGANPSNAAPVPLTATTYTFNSLDCRKSYDFQVTAFIGTIPSDRVVIKSPTILLNPATKRLAPMTIGTVSVENSNLIKFYILPTDIPPANYIFYRSEGKVNNFKQVKTAIDNFYEDTNVEPSKQQYCYKAEYQDACGNTSDQSAAFCSILLTSKSANTLNWTSVAEITPVVKSVSYIIEAIDENGNIIDTGVSTNLQKNVGGLVENLYNLNTNGEAKFRVKGFITMSLLVNGSLVEYSFSVYSNTYTFITPARLYVPTAFSPNNDGINDAFIAQGRYIQEYNLEVYDRWGNVIFESHDLGTGWNGTASDGVAPASAGNYSFKVYGLDTAGQKFKKVGSVILIR